MLYNKHTIYFLTISAVILTAISGCSLKRNNTQTNNQNGQQIATSSEQNQLTTTNSEVISVSDWNIYKNKELGYEIKYPTEWRVDDNNKFVQNKSIVQFNYHANNSQAFFRISIPDYGHGSIYQTYDTKKIKINNDDAILSRRKVIESYKGSDPAYSMLVLFKDKKNNYESSIEFNYTENNKINFEKIFFSMINSLKFF